MSKVFFCDTLIIVDKSHTYVYKILVPFCFSLKLLLALLNKSVKKRTALLKNITSNRSNIDKICMTLLRDSHFFPRKKLREDRFIIQK